MVFHARIIFQLFIIAGTAQAGEFGLPHVYCPLLFSNQEASVQEISNLLEEKIPQGWSGAETLRVSSDSILEITDVYSPGSTSLIVGARTIHGHAALKLYFSADPTTLTTSYWLQVALGDLGMAPKILGIIAGKENVKLMSMVQQASKKFPKLADFKSITLATVMEDVAPIWKSKTNTPFAFTPKQLEQYTKIQKTIPLLKIRPDDVEIIVNRNGNVLLVDLDEFGWVSKDNRFYSIEGMGTPWSDGASRLYLQLTDPLPIKP